MMQKAFAEMDLTSPGSPPFHLIAHVHYAVANYVHDGIYEMLWATPDHWREYVNMGQDGSEIDVAAGDKLYVLRSGAVPSLSVLRARAVLGPHDPGAFAWDRRVTKVMYSVAGGETDICVDSKKYVLLEHACVDPKGELTLIQEGSGERHVNESVDRDDFVSLGEKRYPRHFGSQHSDETMSIRIDVLTLAPDLTKRSFEAPAGAVASDWCAMPMQKGAILGIPPTLNPSGVIPRVVAYYVWVARDGRVSRFVLLQTPNGDHTFDFFLHSASFPVKSCGGKPIEYQALFYFPSSLQ